MAQTGERKVPATTSPQDRVPFGRGVWTTVSVGYRTALRDLGRLLHVVAAWLVAVFVILMAGLLVVAGQGAAIINGALVFGGLGALPVVVGSVAVPLATLATVVATGAVVIVSAGTLIGRPVPARAALVATVRRWPFLLPYWLLVLAVAALAVTAGSLTGSATANAAVGVAVAALVAALALPLPLLTLPVALLEGRGFGGALRRVPSLTRHRRWQVLFAVLAGVLVVPALAQLALAAAALPLSGLAHTVLTQGLRGVLAAVALCFQAATLAAAYLGPVLPVLPAGQAPGPGGTQGGGDPEAAAANLAGPASRGSPQRPSPPGWRTVLVRSSRTVAGLVLPGLLYGAFLTANPLGLGVASDRTFTDVVGSDATVSVQGGPRPVTAVLRGEGRFSLFFCADRRCSDGQENEFGWSGESRPAVAALPGGSAVVASWVRGTSRSVPPWRVPHELRLVRCGPAGCTGLADAPVLQTAPWWASEHALSAAVAATPNGLAVADVVPTGKKWAALRLTFCEQARCATPRSVTVGRVGAAESGKQVRPLAVTVGPDGRVAAAYMDTLTGAVTLAVCDTAACRQPESRQLVGPVVPEPTKITELRTRIDVAIAAGGRPVVVFRHARTGKARLLTCHSAMCSETSSVTLGSPGWQRPTPALALDSAGHPLIATYDRAGERVVLISCGGVACRERSRTPLARVGGRPGSISLTSGADGPPRIMWVDEDAMQNKWGVAHLLTLHAGDGVTG